MNPSPPLDADRLLEHAAWVRRLAGRLLSDPNAADDAAQDAYATALRSGPREGSRTRAWFAAVVRSFVRRAARSDERRARREESAARTERVDSTAEIVERAQASRAVVDAVLALDEPYRSTILMRWFDDLPTARIAELRGEPVETVRTRLKRGHALLREWLSGFQALVVLAEPSRSAVVVAGGFAMTTLGKVAIGAITVAAVSATTWTLRTPEPARSQTSVAKLDAPLPAPEPPVPVSAAAPVAAATVTPEVAPDATSAATNAASSWSDVTATNWKKLVKEDDGETMKKALAGLEDETLDLAAFFRFVDRCFADSIVVPRTEEVTKSGSKCLVKWVQIYSNEKHERSAAKVNYEIQENSRMFTLAFDARSWARGHAESLGLPPDQLEPELTIAVIREAVGNGYIGGFVKLGLGDSGASLTNSHALVDRIQVLKDEKRLPSSARFGFGDGQGQHGWTRSDSELPITVSEVERITALYERFSKAATAVAESASK